MKRFIFIPLTALFACSSKQIVSPPTNVPVYTEEAHLPPAAIIAAATACDHAEGLYEFTYERESGTCGTLIGRTGNPFSLDQFCHGFLDYQNNECRSVSEGNCDIEGTEGRLYFTLKVEWSKFGTNGKGTYDIEIRDHAGNSKCQGIYSVRERQVRSAK